MLRGVAGGSGGAATSLVVGTTAVTGGAAYAVLREDGSQNLTATSALLFGSAAAGHGLQIAAGTAITDVAALSITRTNNNAAVATGVKIAFTDTTSAAGFEPFGVYGGASATTSLLSVSKAGALTIASNLNGPSVFSILGGSRIDLYANSALQLRVGDGFLSFTSNLDVSLSRISAGVLGVGTGAAGSVAGTISAAAFISGGSAGVDFGPAAVLSITVKKGIITAIS